MKQEDLYFAQMLETFFQFMDKAQPTFKHSEDEATYDALRKRIQQVTRQQRLDGAQGTTTPRTAQRG